MNAPGNRLKILIVEDEYIFALDTKQTLLMLGYEVTAIKSSFGGAVVDVEQNKPDLVLMDVQIKGMKDGIETARYLKEKYNVPSLFLTAFTDPETLARISCASPIGVLSKPLDDTKFKEMIHRFQESL